MYVYVLLYQLPLYFFNVVGLDISQIHNNEVKHSVNHSLKTPADCTNLSARVFEMFRRVSIATLETQSTSEKPIVLIFPNGTREVSVGERVDVTCKGVNLPENVKTICYVNYTNYREVINSDVKASVYINDGATKTTIYCTSHFTDAESRMVQSATLTLRLKTEKTHNELTTEPALHNETLYQVGDRFKYNCSAKRGTVQWIQLKDAKDFNTSSFTSVIDIVLDESYNNTYIQCVVSSPIDEGNFEDGCLGTKLILHTPAKTVVLWFIILIVGVLLLVVIAASIYFYTKRKNNKDHRTVEVQNDLYAANYDLVYAQLYDHRGEAPRRPPPAARVPYANVVGYLGKT